MRSKKPFVIMLLVVFCATGAGASQAPVAVSPGSASGSMIADTCPTFSWGSVPGANSYELVVYRLGEEGEEAQPVLRQSFPGSVDSWTPSLDVCLKRGGKYGWSVQAVGEKENSEWSTPALFQVAAPTAEEFQEALEVVRSYLAIQDGTASRPGAVGEAELGAVSDPEPPASAAAPVPRAAAPTALSVDQGIAAASFTGDGSTLTNLDPTALSSGTAGIDISGNAATSTTATTASDLACVGCVDEPELAFDPATDTELAAHQHDSVYVDTSGDVMTGALGMGNNPITDIGAVGTDFTATGGLNLSDNLALAQGETISNSSDEVIRFSDGSDAFDIDLSGSVSLVGAPGAGEFAIEGAPVSGGAPGTSVRIRAGAGDGASDGGGIYLEPGDGGGGGGAGGTVEVLGDLTAVSFIGDGSGLTGVASDTASDLVCTDCVSETELDFGTSTDAELSAHAVANPAAHHAVPTTLPPSGAAGGDLAGSYPNPTVSDDSHGHGDATLDAAMARDAEVDALISAVLTAERHCRGAGGSTDRYTDCGNGTVRDNNTGLIWLQDASCAALPGTTASGMADWADANAAAAALADGTCGLTDGSQAGDWRLPEIGEFCSEDDPTPTIGVCPTGNAVNSLVNTNFGSPALSNAAGVATWDTDGDAFVGVLSNLYWSVTENDATRAWYAHLNDGSVTNTTKVTFLYVWPVRSGSNLLGLASRVDLETHESDADAHREHASLEESAEIDADVAAHAALPGAHHAPTVNTDTLAGLSCADGQIAKWSGSLAQWECGQDQRADTALSFTMSSYSVNEAVGAASISVQRTGDSGGAVSARCDTADGTATAGSDYTATMDTLNWADGDTAVKQCTVPITDDSAEESSQTVNLSLSNVTGGASIGTPASAVLTIEDNDTLLELSFTLSAYAVDEDVGTASIPVQKTGNAPGAVSVQCSTSDGTATAPGDYTATMDTLSWADGESGTKNCTIPIVMDVMVETDETINLTLTNVVGPASIGTPSSAVLTINSNST